MRVETALEQLFFTTVRVETVTPSHPAPKIGSGTAFGFIYQQGERQWPFLVTNKHVIAGSNVGRFFFILAQDEQPIVGQRIDIELHDFESRWHCHHSADVAVMPYMPILKKIEESGKSIFFRSIPHTLVPSAQQIAELDAIEEVFFVGYPNGIFDTRNFTPIARRGTTATPLQLDYDGTPTFMIDASVFRGSSGSPVLICQEGGFTERRRIK